MKTILKRYYEQLPLTRKIILYYIPLSIIPLLMLAVIMSSTYEGLIVDRTLSSASDNSYLIISQTESIFESAEDCGNSLTMSINNIYENTKDNYGPTANLTISNAISNQLSFALLTYPNIESLAFYDNNQVLHTSTYRLRDEQSIFYQSPLYKDLKASTGPNVWFPLEKRNFLVTEENADIAVLSMGKKVVNINNGSTYGYLILNISEKSLNHLLKIQEYNYWIINEDNNIISTNSDDIILESMNNEIFDQQLLNENYYIGVRKLNKKSYVTNMIPFNITNWRLIGQLPYDALTKDLQQLTYFLIFLIVFVIIIDIFSSWFFSYIISKPIRSLNRGMVKVSQGDFDLRLESKSKDEIGSMADSFNHMSSKVEELLTTVQEEQMQKREYEMALIQEQIKPHFLYNCLDVIYTLNLMGRQKDAAKATKALADYYRVTLSNGADIITLEEEVKNVKDYLLLQKIRYSDVFDYSIDFPSELNEFKIIKLTLQPLVENAIYHGLKMKEDFGHLSIKFKSLNDELLITIEDNGLGMNPITLDRLLHPSENRQHFGLYNVAHRIKLFFGNQYGLSIESELHKGTIVTVTIPATKSITERRHT